MNRAVKKEFKRLNLKPSTDNLILAGGAARKVLLEVFSQKLFQNAILFALKDKKLGKFYS